MQYRKDLHKMEYKNISVITENNANINGASWIVNIQTKGDKPLGRKGYSMQFLEGLTCLLIYRGELKDNKINDDGIYLYNIDDKEYKKISIKENNILGCRAYYTMHLNDTNNKLYIIGGINNSKEVLNDILELDINDKENINVIKIEGNDLLNKRFGHKSCNIFFSGDNENELLYHILIFGGRKSENEFHDNSLIDLFIRDNSTSNFSQSNNSKENNISNNYQKENNEKKEEIKHKEIQNNMNKLLNTKEENHLDKNKSNLPLGISNDNIHNKDNSLPTNKIVNNINSSITGYNKINEKEDKIISNNSINNNLEFQKKKQNYVEMLFVIPPSRNLANLKKNTRINNPLPPKFLLLDYIITS